MDERTIIYLDDAIDVAKRLLGDSEISRTMQTALHILPSAQPEIIRCKECKFYTKMRTDSNTGICSLACRHLGDDGFCSEAERWEE